MARNRMYIPEEVKEEIRNHLLERYSFALEGYFSANEEEDALTGDLGASLRIRNQKVVVRQGDPPGTWTWEIDYHKFRGRGKGASETVLGADGIFELTVKYNSYSQTKSLLFQSKIDWIDDPNLLKQAIRLTTWREAAFVLNFTSTAYEAISLDEAIASKGKRATAEAVNLDNFIGNDFLNCHIGSVDLLYNAVERRLIWKSIDNQRVSTKFSIPQRIAIRIIAPNTHYGKDFSYEKEIQPDEVMDYRLDALPEDILSLNHDFTSKDLKKARAKQAKTYHLDKHNIEDDILIEIMNRRMQEVNRAHEVLENNTKKSEKHYYDSQGFASDSTESSKPNGDELT